jgi:uncharacterized delta-60 repeat protein
MDFVKLFAATIAVIAYLVIPGGAFAGPSDFDPTFGAGGKSAVPEDAGYGMRGAAFVALAADGKIVAVSADGDSVGVERFTANGMPDTTFSGDGLAFANVPAPDTINALTGVGVQPDGSIVLGARLYYDPTSASFNGDETGKFLVARFTSSGELDTGFDGGVGANGMLKLNVGEPAPLPPNEYARRLLVQPDGKIVISGGSFYYNDLNTHGAIARLNADGTPDNAFGGGDGKFAFDASTSPDDPRGLAATPDGGYVLSGSHSEKVCPPAEMSCPTQDMFTLYKVTGAGAMDATFTGGPEDRAAPGATGVVTTLIGSVNTDFSEAMQVAARPDGKLFAAGYGNDNGQGRAALARYNADGSLDASFGAGGRALTVLANGGGFTDVLALPDGGALASGYANTASGQWKVMARYLASGALDPLFGLGGIRLFDVDQFSASDQAALQPDGKVVSGTVMSGTAFVFRLTGFPASGNSPPVVHKPTAKIRTPKKSRLKAKSLKFFAGSAGPTGEVSKVEIALRRVDKKLLSKKRCLWLSNAKAKFKKTTAVKKKCSKPRFLKASGTTSWKYKLKKVLKAGRYELYVRVTLLDGTKHSSFTKSQGNLMAFKLT